jgi:hypothetical protein
MAFGVHPTLKANAFLLQLRHRINQVSQGPTKPIKPPDN